MDTFKKQAECLKFLPEYHFGSTRKKPVPTLSSSAIRVNCTHSVFPSMSDLCLDGRESSAARSAEDDGTESEESKEAQ